MSEAEEALALTLNSAPGVNAGVQADHCPKHGGKDGLGGHEVIGNNKDNPSNVPGTTLSHHGVPVGVGGENSANNPGSSPQGAGGQPGGQSGGQTGNGNGKKQDPKEIMKKRIILV